jgi:hypothetical protein
VDQPTRPPADSLVNTVSVPAQGAGTNNNPATLYRAADRPLRVVVRNTGAATLLIAHDTTALQVEAPLAGTFRLPVGASETYVLMPRQSLVAASIGAGGVASIAVSEALPQVWMEA